MKTMKITKNIISREEAVALCPDYVAFAEGKHDSGFEDMLTAMNNARKGQAAITAHVEGKKLIFVRVRIASVKHDDIRAVDGPVVRVANDEYSWRVDGDKYAFIIPKEPAVVAKVAAGPLG